MRTCKLECVLGVRCQQFMLMFITRPFITVCFYRAVWLCQLRAPGWATGGAAAAEASIMRRLHETQIGVEFDAGSHGRMHFVQVVLQKVELWMIRLCRIF